MHFRTFLVVSVLISPIPISVYADECPKEERELADGEQWCYIYIANDNLKIAHMKLNAAYKKLVRELQRRQAESALLRLRESQRAWLKYVADDCSALREFMSIGNPPTIMGAAIECEIERVEKRTVELNRHCDRAPCE